MMKFVESRPFADPVAGARKLIEIAQELVCPQGFAYTGVTNMAFLRAGGSVEEYLAAVSHGQARRLLAIDESGTRITVKQVTAA